MPAATSLYAVLGVGPTADGPTIKAAYRKKLLQDHPDKGGAKHAFQRIKEAYEVLGDAKRRGLYDKFGSGVEVRSAVDMCVCACGRCVDVLVCALVCGRGRRRRRRHKARTAPPLRPCRTPGRRTCATRLPTSPLPLRPAATDCHSPRW